MSELMRCPLVEIKTGKGACSSLINTKDLPYQDKRVVNANSELALTYSVSPPDDIQLL